MSELHTQLRVASDFVATHEPRVQPRRRSTAKTYNPINPAIKPSNSQGDVAWSGPTETFEEKDNRHYFLEDLYGKQDEGLPKDKRARRN